jgi:hypothetical protein
MSEKLSERPIREEKVNRLKTKILAEIEEEHGYLKYLMLDDDDYFDEHLEQYYQLTQLKYYIQAEDTFFAYEMMSEVHDCIVYQISDEDLNIWLQDDYNFVHSFLTEMFDNPWSLFKRLNDEYFGYHFTNFFEKMAYEEKIKRRDSNE